MATLTGSTRPSFTTGPVLRPLATAGLANLTASGILVSRNLMDGWYAAQLSTTALAAFTLAIPVILLLIGLSHGVSVAAGNVLSTRAGAGEPPSATFVTHAVIAALAAGTGLAVLLSALVPLGMAQFPAAPQIMRDARVLAAWLVVGMPVLFLYGVLTALLRAMGDAAGSARATTVGLLVGVAVTPVLTFAVPLPAGTRLVGIAIGTQLGYACTSVLVAVRLRRRGLLALRVDRSALGPDLREFLRRGLPVVATNLVTLAATFVITAVVADTGEAVTAAYGVVSRISQFELIVVNSVILALIPFVGHNFGAGDWSRVRAGVASALGLMAGCWIVAGSAVAVAAPWIARAFELPAQSAPMAVGWLRLSAVAFFFEGVILTAVALLQVLGRARLALLANAGYLYAALLPALLLSARSDDPAGLYRAIAGTQILVGGAFLALGTVLAWRTHRTGPTPRSADARAR